MIHLDRFLEAPQNQYLRGEDGGIGRLVEFVLRDERPDLLLIMPDHVRIRNGTPDEFNAFYRWIQTAWNRPR